MSEPTARSATRSRQTFLFLQGPLSPFFARLADALERRGHRAIRVNLCFGDWLLWRRAGAVDYRGSASAWPAFVRRLMGEEGVTDLVLLGEQRPYHRAAIDAAKALGVRVTVTDFGYLRPDWVTLERDGMSGWSLFPREPDAIRRLAADCPPVPMDLRYSDSFRAQAVWEVVNHLGSWLLTPLYPSYRSHQIHHPVPNYLGTALRLLRRRRNTEQAREIIARTQASGAPYWVFAMQMEVDFSIRAYSPFSDMRGPLEAVITAFAAGAPADGVLLIKLHPLDPGLRPWRRLIAGLARAAGVEERVRFIDGGALDPLMQAARGVVTVNSTVGLKALQLGVPVTTLGEALYDVPGLTFQGPLRLFWSEAAAPDPALLDAFVRAIADLLHVRGVYYRRPGLDAAVDAAADRLEAPKAEALAARLAAARTNPGHPGVHRLFTAAQH